MPIRSTYKLLFAVCPLALLVLHREKSQKKKDEKEKEKVFQSRSLQAM